MRVALKFTHKLRSAGASPNRTLVSSTTAEVKARKPLRDAKIEVVDVPGKPGAYRAVAFLKPHFQLDELTISLRLVADLPQGAK